MRRVLLITGATLTALIGGAIWAGIHVRERIRQPYKGFEGSSRLVEIPSGANAAEIRRRLAKAGVIADEFAFRAALIWTGRSRALQAGEYRFDAPMSALDVIDKMTRGEVYGHPVTFPEGLTIREMADLYEAGGFGAAAEFLAAAQDTSLIADLDDEAQDLEGYLFPETYALARGTRASTLIGLMVDRFRAAFDGLSPQTRESPRLSTRQIVTLASLVEKETAKADERPLIASVYWNRLAQGMLLQADPTVIYALVLAGTYDGNIRRRDLQIDSPYNTYRYPGLPPGPIAAPGRAALDAARNPGDSPYLFFVSRNDGSHAFAETLRQHNANVYEHQVLYFRKQRLDRRAQAQVSQ
jgi:UPF0755 protein